MALTFYVIDKNGEYSSQDGEIKYRKLVGSEIFYFLRTEDSKGKRFYIDDGIAFEVPKSKEKIVTRHNSRKYYVNKNLKDSEIEIIHMYGATKISNMLNDRGIKTKRDCKWTSNAICRILENELYTGKIVNGKSEVADFLTGRRTTKNEDEWFVTVRPELRIIDEDTFQLANKLKKDRVKMYKNSIEKHSNRHLFSTLIKCKDCGWS